MTTPTKADVRSTRDDNAMPLSLALRNEAILAGEDLEKRLVVANKERLMIRRFIGEQMVEADYDAKGRPIKGKMHDYYTLPGYDKKTPTKQGAEKVAGFANLRRAQTQTVARECTKEFAMAEVQVQLVDRFGQPAGSGTAAATTAEAGFQQAAKKYGKRTDDKGKLVAEADWRAAYNDIVARAGKRAFVQAIIYATATDDMFDASGEIAQKAEAAGVDEEANASRPRFPAKFGNVSGKYIDELKSEQLVTIREWCKTKAKRPAALQPIVDAIDNELEHRRVEAEGDADEGPSV